MIIDNFDEMPEQSKAQPLVMGVALHAYIVGQPFRLRHLSRALQHIVRYREEAWITTAGAVAAHVMALLDGTLPGTRAERLRDGLIE